MLNLPTAGRLDSASHTMELEHALKNIKVRTDIIEEDKYLYLFSVEEVNKLVQSGIPFRDAYKTVAEQLENGTFKSPKATKHTHEGSINNLCLEEIKLKMNTALTK